ncbi:FHA domain-containing protein [uncultured Pseudokineococcus sp.]|uniref:FHA domain-containing protein FhaB/FipA n=1 Tax=uncultured Pseudokineococcus sp. TaxID=1642928 RepID=UPI002624B055|nr:FHA domain-containing protein [uncultured Pseudokineococcus sp.]
MSELTYTVLRLGLLVLLWVLVLSVVGVLRRDVFGTRVVSRPSGDRAQGQERRRPGSDRRASPPPPPPPPEDRTVPRQVVVVEGPLRGTSLALGGGPVLVGRSPECALVLDDDYASGRHARLFPRDGRWWVEDLGSTNGTLLGRDPLGAPAPLPAGSQLRIGRTVLELRR